MIVFLVLVHLETQISLFPYLNFLIFFVPSATILLCVNRYQYGLVTTSIVYIYMSGSIYSFLKGIIKFTFRILKQYIEKLQSKIKKVSRPQQSILQTPVVNQIEFYYVTCQQYFKSYFNKIKREC